MKTKILFKNLFIFSDGSSFLDFTFFTVIVDLFILKKI